MVISGVTITSIGMPKDMLKSKDDFGRKLTKPALQEAASFWHDKFLPRHFRSGAASRYKYRPRKPSTLKRKSRLASRSGRPEARLPLVMSGTTKKMVSRMVKVTGTGKSAKASMTGPRYVHMYSKGGDRPYLAGEITAVTEQEANKLGRIVGDIITRNMKDNKEKTVTRIR